MRRSIEVVIPVHDPSRPLGRCVASVLAQGDALAAASASLAVTVVCHNVPVDAIARSLDAGQAEDDAVTLVAHVDGAHSAAGPRNAALARSRADFLTFLDSDDYLEPGSLTAWLALAETEGADAVIAPLRTPAGSILTAPRIRPAKPPVVDPVRDGLAYRSVPYGLLRREALVRIGFAYTEGVPTGEDIEPTLKLWFGRTRICYPYGAPAYRQTDDSGTGRVTSTIRTLADEFQWLDAFFAADWPRGLSVTARRTIAVKFVRVHGIGALLRRADAVEAAGADPAADAATTESQRAELWNEAERACWARLYSGLQSFAGGSLPALSRRDAALARAATAAADPAQLRAAVVRYRSAGRLGELLPARVLGLLSRDAVALHYVQEKRRARAGVFSAP